LNHKDEADSTAQFGEPIMPIMYWQSCHAGITLISVYQGQLLAFIL